MIHEAASRLRPYDRFAAWATQYEDDALSRLLTSLALMATARLRLQPADWFLDVGCGTGAAVRAATATAQVAIGVDVSSAMIHRARTLSPNGREGRFIVGEAERLPFRSATFTAVLSTATLRHVTDPALAAREMTRVLRPGGRIVVADLLARVERGADGRWAWLRRGSRRARLPEGPLRAVADVGALSPTGAAPYVTPVGLYWIVAAAKTGPC